MAHRADDQGFFPLAGNRHPRAGRNNENRLLAKVAVRDQGPNSQRSPAKRLAFCSGSDRNFPSVDCPDPVRQNFAEQDALADRFRLLRIRNRCRHGLVQDHFSSVHRLLSAVDGTGRKE